LNKTLKHSYIYISGSLLQALIPFLIIPVLTRSTSQSEFGLIMLLISIGTVLSFGFSLGIPAVLSRELIFDENRSLHLKKLSAGYQTLMIWLAATIYFVTIFIDFSTSIKILFLSLVLALSLAGIQIKLSVLRAEFKSLQFAFLAIASTATPLIAITTLPYFLNVDLYRTYAGITVLVLLITNISNLFPKFELVFLKDTKDLVIIGFPIIFHGIAISLFQYGDKIASYLGIGAELVSQVVIISLFMTAPMLLLSTINNAWLPASLESFKKSSGNGFSYLHKTSQNLTLFITLVCVILIILSKTLVSIFVPDNYNFPEITKAIVIGISFTPLYVLYLQNTHLLTMNKKFKSLGKITPISALIQFFVTFGLISVIGLNAPAYGLLVAISIQVTLTTISAKSFSKLNKLPLYLTGSLSIFSFVYLNLFF
jgi:O-antigen/teichoic acid export membrane protein